MNNHEVIIRNILSKSFLTENYDKIGMYLECESFLPKDGIDYKLYVLNSSFAWVEVVETKTYHNKIFIKHDFKIVFATKADYIKYKLKMP